MQKDEKADCIAVPQKDGTTKIYKKYLKGLIGVQTDHPEECRIIEEKK